MPLVHLTALPACHVLSLTHSIWLLFTHRPWLGQGLVLTEIAPDTTVEEVQAATGATLIVAEDLRVLPY